MGWSRLKAVLGYGIGITTTCFVAGVVVTWVRYEALAGIGKYAVVSSDQGEIVATGVTSLLGMVGYAIATIIALVAWFWWKQQWKQQPESSLPVRAAKSGQRVGRPAWDYIARHPWRAHLLAPLVSVALAKWMLPDAVALPVALAAFLSLLAGAVRGLAEIVAKVAEGKGRWARRARLPLFLLLGVGALFITFSWVLVAVVVVVALLVAVVNSRTRGVPPDALSFRYFVKYERGLIATYFAVMLVVFAVGSEADQPTGLTIARVTPVQGRPFEAIPLGQHSGRAAFLDTRRLRANGIVELAPGNIRRVEITHVDVDGRRNDHSFATRLVNWASRPAWSLE